MTAALVCESLTVRYKQAERAALVSLNLQVRAGERVALMGLNGSGKTTLLMAIAGLVPICGKIAVEGIGVERATLKAVRAKLGFLFSTPDDQLLFPRVLDDVAFTLERHAVAQSEAQARAHAILSELGIGELAQRSAHQLSQGQRQRVALAGALIARPPLLLLDEPTSALDPPGRRELAHLLTAQSCAMLIATHDTAFAKRVATRFITLAHGEITADTSDPAILRGFDDE